MLQCPHGLKVLVVVVEVVTLVSVGRRAGNKTRVSFENYLACVSEALSCLDAVRKA